MLWHVGLYCRLQLHLTTVNLDSRRQVGDAKLKLSYSFQVADESTIFPEFINLALVFLSRRYYVWGIYLGWDARKGLWSYDVFAFTRGKN